MSSPHSTHIQESRVIQAPIERVWALIRPLNFSFLSTVTPAAGAPAAAATGEVSLGALKTIAYKDGTRQTYKVLELSDLHHFITYDLIESNPPIKFMSAIHTIRLSKVSHDNTTFIQWESDYSGDASTEVLQDSRFKKIEGFEELVKFLKSN